jgi:CBS domain-containing protein
VERTRLLAAVALPAALLAGCTSFADRPSGPELVRNALSALEEAGSFSVEVTQEVTDLSRFDVHYQDDDAIGTIATGDKHDAPLVVVDGQVYLLPPEAFYTEFGGMSEEEAAPFIGRYVTGPADEESSGWPASVDYVTEELLPAPDEVADEVEHTYVNGRAVFVVTAHDGRRLAVATREPNYPVRLVVPADDDVDGRGAPDGAVAFSRFGEREAITRPANPVTPEDLGG